MKPVLNVCIVLACLLTAGAVFAQAPTVTSSLTAQRVEMVDGKSQLKPAADGKPGDVIEYTGNYRNTGAAPVAQLQAVVPVPVGTTLIAGSVMPAAAQASTDGTTFAAMPLMRSVRQADGSQRRVAVPLADYRAVRWDIGALPAAGNTAVSLRVRIDTPALASAAPLVSATPNP